MGPISLTKTFIFSYRHNIIDKMNQGKVLWDVQMIQISLNCILTKGKRVIFGEEYK